MIFRFELGFGDAYRLCAQLYWGTLPRLLKNFSAMFGVWIFVCLFPVNFNLIAWISHGPARDVAGGLVFSVLFLPLLALFSAWRVARLTRSLGASRTLTLSPDGLDLSFGNSRVQHAWKGILRAEEGKQAFYFYLTKRSALVLPKRALTSKKDLDSLRALLSGAGVIVQ